MTKVSKPFDPSFYGVAPELLRAEREIEELKDVLRNVRQDVEWAVEKTPDGIEWIETLKLINEALK